MRQRGIDALCSLLCAGVHAVIWKEGPCFKIQSENQGKGTHSSTRPTENPLARGQKTWPSPRGQRRRSPCYTVRVSHTVLHSAQREMTQTRTYFRSLRTSLPSASCPCHRKTGLCSPRRGEGVQGLSMCTGDTQQDTHGLRTEQRGLSPCAE